jgi:hypothetical protein
MTTTFDVLAEPSRRQILDLLREGERAVGELVTALPLSQPSVSKHLRVLREVGDQPVDWFSIGYAVFPLDGDESGESGIGGPAAAPAWVAQHLASLDIGWAVADDTTWNPGSALNVGTGFPFSSANGRLMHAFFFIGDEYIGKDTEQPSSVIRIAWTDDNTVAIKYSLYAPDDPGCCPTMGYSTVRYHGDGQQLTPLDQIPPLEGPVRR